MTHAKHRFAIPALGLALMTASCAVGPNYKRPASALPQAFKEAGEWKTATPEEAASRGPWWQVFNDPILSGFEDQVVAANLSLQVSAANYEQARQIARADVAGFLPVVSADGSAERSYSGAGRGSAASGVVPQTTYSASLSVSWAPDFWGKTRRQTEADVASAQASAAALALARLSTQALLAQDYVDLRITDENRRLLQNALDADRKALEVTQNKYSVGVSARSDVISAEAAVDAARASVLSVGVQRAQYEHAIAVLLGKAPSELSIEAQPAMVLSVPGIPAQMPSALLERRPDIAEAERQVAFANARVGVQEAAYFPDISLTGDLGYQGSPLHELFNAANRFWSLGASGSETILDFGARHAGVLEAKAAYEGAVASYRQTVLTAFQGVEDNLAELRIRGEEATVQDTAVKEAAQAAQIALNEYRAGTVDYTTVVTALVSELNDRETALTILENRLTSSVALIENLGGGWTADSLPGFREIESRHARDAAGIAAPK